MALGLGLRAVSVGHVPGAWGSMAASPSGGGRGAGDRHALAGNWQFSVTYQRDRNKSLLKVAREFQKKK